MGQQRWRASAVAAERRRRRLRSEEEEGKERRRGKGQNCGEGVKLRRKSKRGGDPVQKHTLKLQKKEAIKFFISGKKKQQQLEENEKKRTQHIFQTSKLKFFRPKRRRG